MRVVILLLICFCVSVKASGGNPLGNKEGEICIDDLQCFDYCCSNNLNYTMNGTCVPYKDN